MKGEKGMPGVGQKVIIIIITHISLILYRNSKYAWYRRDRRLLRIT